MSLLVVAAMPGTNDSSLQGKGVGSMGNLGGQNSLGRGPGPGPAHFLLLTETRRLTILLWLPSYLPDGHSEGVYFLKIQELRLSFGVPRTPDFSANAGFYQMYRKI